mmetsp:Transcript_28706/g.78975  ORF Transcript_28706/g.78975 Transcript_28706/m.78975 type:complete len:207 (+) Transcript_28706:271-891(+)
MEAPTIAESECSASCRGERTWGTGPDGSAFSISVAPDAVAATIAIAVDELATFFRSSWLKEGSGGVPGISSSAKCQQVGVPHRSPSCRHAAIASRNVGSGGVAGMASLANGLSRWNSCSAASAMSALGDEVRLLLDAFRCCREIDVATSSSNTALGNASHPFAPSPCSAEVAAMLHSGACGGGGGAGVEVRRPLPVLSPHITGALL